MKKLRININGKEVTGFAEQTILDVARENGIDIPTLCYDERTEVYGSCGLCMVEVEGNPKLLKACATPILSLIHIFINAFGATVVRKCVLRRRLPLKRRS